MNKTAIKNFAIWARNKLIADIQYRAGLMGIMADGIKDPLPQSTGTMEFYDIGIAEPYAISGEAIAQRKKLVEIIRRKEADSSYATAYKYILEEVAYTWFNRLIAIRFMEVNDYLPSRIRVLSSESGKIEPDLVTTPFDAELTFTPAEEETVLRLKTENKLDELFRLLFIKQCNALNEILPALFEKTSDYTELLLNLSMVDQEGVVYHLIHDIDEDDFNIEKGGQVEIIGWLYQYYNTEPKNAAFAKKGKVTKEEIPAVTQLFTPDWIVRYMVENSLGRTVINNLKYDVWAGSEKEKIDQLKSKWKYYIDEAEQAPDVDTELRILEHNKYANDSVRPFIDVTFIDPCMGSGHILVYAFEVLMQIYESQGWSQRDAAQSILKHNLYGLDIDDRAAQLAYFAVMMKARQYDRRILTRGIQPNLYAIQESDRINRIHLSYLGAGLTELERNDADNQIRDFLDSLKDAKDFGSLRRTNDLNWPLLHRFVSGIDHEGQLSIDAVGLDDTCAQLQYLLEVGETLARQYDVVVTNPPYMAVSNGNVALNKFVKENYPDSKGDLFACFMERCGQFIRKDGYQAMITQHSWMFLSSFEKLRIKLFRSADIVNMAHLGPRAFEEIGGEVVQTTSFVLRNSHIVDYKGTYCRLIEPTSQQGKEEMFLACENRYTAQQSDFSKIPGSPVAYWVSKSFIQNYKSKSISSYGAARSGLQTGDNNRFLRFWQEVDYNAIALDMHSKKEFLATKKKWTPQIKGGEYRKWYGNFDYIVNWENDGAEIRKCDGCRLNAMGNDKLFFQKGITWSHTTSGVFGARYLPGGCLFNVEAPTLFVETNYEYYLLAYLNSTVAQYYLNAINMTLHYLVGNISNLPVVYLRSNKIDELTKENIDISIADWDSYEISWNFKRHPMTVSSHTVVFGEEYKDKLFTHLIDHYRVWKKECEDRFINLQMNEEELNRIFIDIYGLQDELPPDVADKDVTVHRIFDTKDDVPESMQGSSYVRTKRDEIASLLSYAVGCMFGRYSLDRQGLVFAGGNFDSVYWKFKGQAALDENDNPIGGGYAGITLASYHYPKFHDVENCEDAMTLSYEPDADNIIPITDEEYLEDDILSRLCDWLKAAYGEDTLEENLDFIADALGGKGNSSREIIRNYFLKDFFKDHCKTYQKRPIYWLFDSGKQNGFKALIYLHRYTPDTIGNLRVDYLHKMQRVYESEINRMQDMIDHSTNAREVAASTKRKEKLQKQLKECRDYDEMIAHLALSRIELDLDNGVKVNYEKIQTASDGKKYAVLAKI